MLLRILSLFALICKALLIQLNEDCSSNSIFDTTSLLCSSCPNPKIPDSFNRECVCPAKTYYDEDLSIPPLSLSNSKINYSRCSPCRADQVSSLDRTKCLNCPINFDPITKECVCNSSEIVVEVKNAIAKSCVACPVGSLPYPFTNGGAKYECRYCEEGQRFEITSTGYKCSCSLNFIKAGDRCINSVEADIIIQKYSPLTARTLTYKYLEYGSSTTSIVNSNSVLSTAFNTLSNSNIQTIQESVTINSDLIDYLYLDSADRCINDESLRHCQIIANLCVLQMYDENTQACLLYNTINNSKSLDTSLNNE